MKKLLITVREYFSQKRVFSLKYARSGIMAAVVLLAPLVAKADDKIFLDFGDFKVNVPFASVSTSALWDFKSKIGLAGLETPILSYKRLAFTGGGVTSLSGQGTPFVGFHVALVNPLENLAPLASLNPGIFGGRNFHAGSYMVGLTLSTAIW